MTAPKKTKTPAAYDKELAADAARKQVKRDEGRDIGPLLVSAINWERRLACKFDLELFGRSYMANVFKLPSCQDHLRCNAVMQRAFMEGGLFALAMPRGGGKTAKCRAAMLWGVCYGHRRYPYLIGANDDAALGTLKALRMIALQGEELLQDFPEIFWPIRCLGQDSGHKARGQLYLGDPTWLEWGADKVKLPSLLLKKKVAQAYLDNDPSSLVQVNDAWLPVSSGSVLYTAGITAGVRGGNEMHPVTLELMRPDVILLDDIQKDQGAESPATCAKLLRLVDGAIGGLAGPGESLAMVMPCTVIREGDVSDTYLDRSKRPEWQGERCRMVVSWPEGLSDYEIPVDTAAGKLWNKYSELRRESLRMHGDMRDATVFYYDNHHVMDEGFVVSWSERYVTSRKSKWMRELSAQQHAMNRRLSSPETFPAEYQNRPKPIDSGAVLISPITLRERTWSLGRGEVPADTHTINAFIDVQNEILFWLILATDPGYTGAVIDYGTWPRVETRYFRKFHSEGWGLLTSEAFKAHPELRGKAERTAGGKLRAPLEAKLYHALKQCVAMLLAKEFPRSDLHGSTMRLTRIGIDARWGKASDCIKRFVRDTRRNEVIPYQGVPISPANKQLEEYERRPGWLFEDQLHPGLQEAKWVWRPDSSDGMYRLSADVNRLKTFTMERLACPLGTPGSITLFDAPPEQHEMISDHIAGSEYPEPVTARGRTKDQWKLRDANPDNDYFDCLVGAVALAGWGGARLSQNPSGDNNTKPQRRKWSDIASDKRSGV
jgi:hypothetical protein